MYKCDNASCERTHSSTKRSLCKQCFDSAPPASNSNNIPGIEPELLGATSLDFSGAEQETASNHNNFLLGANAQGYNNTATSQPFRHTHPPAHHTQQQHPRMSYPPPPQMPQAPSANLDNIFSSDFMNSSLTAITVADLVTIITKVNNATVMTRLQNIDAEIGSVKNKIETLQENEEKNKKEFDKFKTATNAKIAKAEQANKQSKEMTTKMSQILRNHQQAIDSVEFEKRARNVVIRGIPENDPPNEEADAAILEEVMEQIGVEIEPFPDTRRLGKLNTDSRYHRAILLECGDKGKVNEIIEKSKQLGDLSDDDPSKKIFIQRDLPPSIREGNFKLRQQLRAEKAKTENAGVELKLDYKKGTISRVQGEDETVIFTSKHPF